MSTETKCEKKDEHTCPLCKKPMRVRTGSRGPFYGCSGYPACRHTYDVPAGYVAPSTTPGESSYNAQQIEKYQAETRRKAAVNSVTLKGVKQLHLELKQLSLSFRVLAEAVLTKEPRDVIIEDDPLAPSDHEDCPF